MGDSNCSPQKPIMAQSTNPDQNSSNPNNPAVASSPAITSPSMSDISQQSNLDAASLGQDYALKQQQQQQQTNLNYQQQLQRSNSVQRLTQLQQQNQQFGGAGMSAQALRMYAAGSGQMNFGGGVQQQQLMNRAGIMGQVGLSMLPGQTAAHYALQNPMLSQQRQKSMVQNAQFSTGNVGQVLSGMQSMGVMNTLGMNQIRTGGPLSYAQQQRFSQMRAQQQQIPSPSSLPSPQKMGGQGLGRSPSLSSMTPQQQQQFLKQMTPQQQQVFMQQLSQQKQHQMQQFQLQQFQLQQSQQQQQNQSNSNSNSNSPRVLVGNNNNQLNRTASLTSSQQESNNNNVGNNNNNNNGIVESGNQLLGKRKIQDLVAQVDPMINVGDAVEDFLLEIADDFFDSVTEFACNFAKHRKSNIIEPKDVLLHLEKNWKLTMPGYSRDEKKQRTNLSTAEAHKRRMEMIKAMVQAQQEQGGMRAGVQVPLMAANNNMNISNMNNNINSNNNMSKPVVITHNEMGNEHPIIRTVSNPEAQFSLPSVAMMQKVPRF